MKKIIEDLKGLKLTLADFSIIWIIFFSIVYQKLAPLGFIFWILTSFLSWKKSNDLNFLSSLLRGNQKWFIAYYLLLVIAMFWSDNTAFGLSKLENKLSFVLFPILFSISKIQLTTKSVQKVLIFSLIFSLVGLELYALIRALTYNPTIKLAYFGDPYFCVLMHRSYFACYLVIGIILLLENQKNSLKFWKMLLVFFLSIGVFQTGSKAGIISLFIVILIYTISTFPRSNKMIGFTLLSLLILLFSFLFFTENRIKRRFEVMTKSFQEIKFENNSSLESNSSRLVMWNTSILVWKENFIYGTGTGDYDDQLTKKNNELKNLELVKKRYNSHNQFLNTGVQLGLVGFIILILLFASSFLNCKKSTWRILILIVFFINFLVESFLETQSGIVLFCILLTLFYSKNNVDFQLKNE